MKDFRNSVVDKEHSIALMFFENVFLDYNKFGKNQLRELKIVN